MKAVLFDLGRVLVHYDHQQTVAAIATLAQAPVDAVHQLLRDHSHALGVGDLDADAFHTLIFFVEAVDDETRAHYETPYHDTINGVTVEPLFVTTVE